MSNLVSVILPTYNRTRSLKAAMMSVLTQSYEALELIVVDDGSSEDVEGLVRSVQDERIRYIARAENGGAAAARNTGLGEARGKFIAFQDSDDIWLPGKLERHMRLLESLPARVGVITGAKIIYGRDERFRFGPGKVAFAPPPEGRLELDGDQIGQMLTDNRISLQNALFRRDCYPHPQWFDTTAPANEDWEFAIRLVQHTTVYEDGEPVVMGFISSDSISSNSRKQTIGLLRVIRNNRELLKSRKVQRSKLLLEVSRAMYRRGRFKLTGKFLLASLRDDPQSVVTIIASAFRKLRN